MSTKTIGIMFAFCVLGNFFLLIFSNFIPTNNEITYISLQLVLLLCLGILFTIIIVHYAKNIELIETKHQLFLSLYENGQDSIFILDTDGCFVRANSIATKAIGFDEQNIAKVHYSKYVKENVLEDITNCFKRALKGEKMTTEIEFATSKGKSFYAEIHFSPVMIHGTVGSVIVSLKDVTEQTEVKHALKEIQRNFKLINEHSSELIAILDENGKLEFATPSFEHVFGKKPDDYYGKNPLEALNQPSLMKTSFNIYRKHLEQNEKMYHAFARKDENGEMLYFETVGTPIVESNGEAKGAVCVTRNVTERKKQEDMYYQTARLNIIGETAAGIVHEIKNPLASIRGFVQLFESKDQHEQHQSMYKLVLDEIDRVNDIVMDLLTLAKPKENEMSLLNMTQTIEETKQFMASEAVKYSVIIEYHMPEEVNIIGDKNQLKQVFINVIKNAIEASTAGGKILIETEKRENDFLISIQDEGCGIEEERIEHLGEAFHTSKEQGTGLGLMVSKRIIQDHGGVIRFESAVGKGTTVKITLPIV